MCVCVCTCTSPPHTHRSPPHTHTHTSQSHVHPHTHKYTNTLTLHINMFTLHARTHHSYTHRHIHTNMLTLHARTHHSHTHTRHMLILHARTRHSHTSHAHTGTHARPPPDSSLATLNVWRACPSECGMQHILSGEGCDFRCSQRRHLAPSLAVQDSPCALCANYPGSRLRSVMAATVRNRSRIAEFRGVWKLLQSCFTISAESTPSSLCLSVCLSFFPHQQLCED